LNKEDFKPFLKKRIRITRNTPGRDIPAFYTGYIKKINEDSILIVDKYSVLIMIAMKDIIQIEEQADPIIKAEVQTAEIAAEKKKLGITYENL